MSAPAAESFVRAALALGERAGPAPPERLDTVDARVLVEIHEVSEPIVLDLTRRRPAPMRRWRPRRRPPAPREPEEIRLQLSLDDAVTLARGRLGLAAALMAGTVRADGPVRRLLAVDPVLRTWLRGEATEPGSIAAAPREVPAARVPTTSAPADLDPDWLAVETRALETSIGGRRTLKGASLRVPEGVISVLIGPSGAGKSVLLAHLVGLLMPDTGDTIVRGRTLNRLTRSALLDLRMDIGVLADDGAPLSSMDLFDNVAFPLRQNTNLAESEIRDRVTRQLARLGLSAQSHDRPHELSPSQRRRAGLARALAPEPTLLVCDEPDFGLEVPGLPTVAQLLLDHHATVGGTVVVVTDNLALAAAIADHVSVIEDGRVVASHLIGSTEPSANPYLRRFRELAEV